MGDSPCEGEFLEAIPGCTRYQKHLFSCHPGCRWEGPGWSIKVALPEVAHEAPALTARRAEVALVR